MRAAYCGAALALAFSTLHAQQTGAKPVHVTIIVEDPSEVAVPSAQIDVALVPEGGIKALPVTRGVANEDGYARFDLVPGQYQLDVVAPGFLSMRMALPVTGSRDQWRIVGLCGGECSEGFEPTVHRLETIPLRLTETIPAPPLPQLKLPPRAWKASRGRR
jgi:hypothetical protein